MKLLCQALVIVVTAGVLSSGAAGAATLVIEYDAATGWDGSEIADTSGNAYNALVPDTRPDAWVSPPTWAGPPIPGSEFATPAYMASGAGPADRPYLDFDKLGMLRAWPSEGPDVFGATGYTQVAYLNLGSDLDATSNAAIGTVHNTSYQNILLTVNTSGALNSYTVLRDNGANAWKQANSNVNSLLPRDEWFHLVKVHDRAAKEVRFYVDGGLVLTTAMDPGAGTWQYVDRGDHLGQVGFDPYWQGGRQIRGMGYSYFASYDGLFDEADIAASYDALTAVDIPEPATLGLLALGALGAVARRRRR